METRLCEISPGVQRCLVPTMADFSLAKIAESGQCFRLCKTAPGKFRLVALGRVLQLVETPQGVLFGCTPQELETLWRPYFDLDTDYAAIGARVPASDSFLSAALAYGRGIRILRQQPWETLITFILSQRKNIPAIRACVEALCTAFGTPVTVQDGLFSSNVDEQLCAFPSPQQLAAASVSQLAACGLGYRTKYVKAAAEQVCAGTLSLPALAALKDAALRRALEGIYGVGPKVADCVLLFGYHRIAAFPRDVWINRVIAEEYGGHFPLRRYSGCAGVIQQYMFYYGRTGR